MRVVYSDESGTGDGKQPITVVTAILLNMDSQWEPVERELSSLKATMPRKLLRGTNADPSPYLAGQARELKGTLLFKGVQGKIRGVEPWRATKALMNVLSVAVRHRIHIFHGAIDRAGREQWSHEHGFSSSLQTDEEAAFDECLRRLDGFVDTFMSKERVLWIADKSGFETSVKRGLRFFQWVQAIDTENLRRLLGLLRGTEDVKSFPDRGLSLRDDRPSYVTDTIYFGDSHESLALQLADVCCATITRNLLGKYEAGPFYNLIRRQIVTDGTAVVYSDAWRGIDGKTDR